MAFFLCSSVLQANFGTEIYRVDVSVSHQRIRVLGSGVSLLNNLECRAVFFLSLHSQSDLSLIPLYFLVIRLKVLTAFTMKGTVFWNVTPYSLVEVNAM